MVEKGSLPAVVWGLESLTCSTAGFCSVRPPWLLSDYQCEVAEHGVDKK